MRVLLFNLINWLCDDSNLIKALLIALAVLLILVIFTGVYFNKIIDRRNERKWRRRSGMRTDWEPKRPHDLTNSYDNPWDVVSGQNDTEHHGSGKVGVKIALLLAILAVLAIVIFIIFKKMG